MLHARIAFYLTLCWYQFATCSQYERKTDVLIKLDPQIDPFILQTGGSFIYLLRASTAYVDKTLFIKFILEHEKNIIWITLPVKWAKSHNLKMLEAFLTPYIDHKGHTEPISETVSYKFFKEGKIMSMRKRNNTFSSPPLISKHEHLMKEYLGRYPVIYVEFDLIGVANNTCFETFFFEFTKEIEYQFTAHCYLETYLQEIIHNQKTTVEDKKIAEAKLEKFRLYLYWMNYTGVEMLETSMLFLSQLLHERFRKPVFIMMDEFIRVVNVMFMYSNHEPEYQNKILTILRNFLRHTILENRYLKKAVLTGILPYAQDILFPNNTDIARYSFIDNAEILGFYGFLQHEVDALFRHFKISPDQQEQAIDFYKGFTLKPNSDVVVYQPFSMIRFLDWQDIDTFFRDYSSFFPLRNWFAVEKFRKMLRSMLNGSEVTVKRSAFTLDERKYTLPKAVDVWENNNTVEEQGFDYIFSLLCHGGFLTLTNRTDTYTPPGKITLRIPSVEIWLGINETLFWNFTATRNRRFGLKFSTPG